jgi:CubicO group peptidase (beta-lactamase class C family)
VIHEASEAFLQMMVEDAHFAGGVLVIRGGNTVHRSGYGNATASEPNTADTVFHVASVTKQFTAAAVLQLVEQGVVALATSVNEYLPDDYRSASWDPVTIHHLLSHTAGVPDYAVSRDYYEVVDGFCLGDTVDGMVREAAGKDLQFKPGSQFAYSNIGYTLLGLVIEHQTSEIYGEYLHTNILEPMGMTSSKAHVIGHVRTTHEAEGHRWSDELSAHVSDDVQTLPVTAPDGGLITTLDDFAKWVEIYLGGPQQILTSASIDLMTSPIAAMTDERMPAFDARGHPQSYGYGLFVSESLVGHPGYIVGFRSHFILDRSQELLIAVFSNNTTNDPIEIATGLLAIAD